MQKEKASFRSARNMLNHQEDARQSQGGWTDSVAFASVGGGPGEQSFFLLSWSVGYKVSGRSAFLSRGPTCPLSILGSDLHGQGPAFTSKAAVTLCQFRVVATELLPSFFFMCSSCTQTGQMPIIWSFTAHTAAWFASVPQKTLDNAMTSGLKVARDPYDGIIVWGRSNYC